MVIVVLHVVASLAFAAMAVRSALLGDPVFAVMQGVLAVLVVALGVGVARAV